MTSIDLPAWTAGSEKQQTWADSIRADVIAWVDTATRLYSQPRPAGSARAGDPATAETDAKVAAALTARLAQMVTRFTDPAWYITSRGAAATDWVTVRAAQDAGLKSFTHIATRVRKHQAGDPTA